MRFRRILPPPGWSGRWFAGAGLCGLIMPAIVGMTIMVVGFHPIGGALPRSMFWSEFGVTLSILTITLVFVTVAPLYALLAWSWRPIVLVLILVCGIAAGSFPGMMLGRYVKVWALDSFSGRSQPVIDAIINYTRVTGAPPGALEELVPAYLPFIPGTQIAAQHFYRYAPNQGPCSAQNTWHLSVSFAEFFSAYRLLYCPRQDYGHVDTIDMGRWRRMFGPWMYDEVGL